MNVRKHKALTYDDVLLAPKLGIVKSRSTVRTNTFLTKDISMRIPIVAAPMSSVTNALVAQEMADLGGAAFIHRNQTPEVQLGEWYNAERMHVGCAIGTTEPWNQRFKTLYDGGCKLFCLDIAHAHSIYTQIFFREIPDKYLDASFILGSFATAESIEWALEWLPVAGFRVGIGPGAACTTRERTGHGVPQLTAVAECVEAAGDIPVIADGGINTSGDIVKALAAGASSVMLGRLLASAQEGPHPGLYFGMASKTAKLESGYSHEFTEGIEAPIKIEGFIQSIIEGLLAGVKSGISYSGADDIEGLQQNHEFIIVSQGTERESKVRI